MTADVSKSGLIPSRSRSSVPGDAAPAALADFVRASTAPRVMVDRAFRVLSHSGAWAELLGSPGGDLRGQSLVENLDPDDPLGKSFLERALCGRITSADQIAFSRPDAGVLWWSSEIVPWRNSCDAIGGLIVSSEGAPVARTSAENQLRLQRRLELAIKLAGLYVWEADLVGQVLYADPVPDISDLEFTFEQVIGDPLIGCHPADRDRLRRQMESDTRAGTSSPIEYRANRSDDKIVWVRGVAEIIRRPDGQADRVVGVMQNITERKVAELELAEARQAADAANRAKTAFLATVSHEIRTPLNGVLGMVDAMSADALSPLQAERLAVIRHSGRQLLATLNDFLDIAKIEAGKLELEDIDIDVETLATAAAASFDALASAKGIVLDVAVDPSATGRYRGDPTRIRQILNNLISNALKFTETGRVDVRVDAAEAGVRFTVSDTGPGIAEDHLERLFEKFEQQDASTTRRHGGTGLGLAICRELAERMGGSISVCSRPGEGAIFTVRLPLPGVERTKDHERANEPAPLPRADASTRILVAEDHPTNRYVIRTLLEQAGLNPKIVCDGAEAVDAWRREAFDVILMDVHMPTLDGIAATEAIRRCEAEEGRRRTAIIALTADAMTHQIRAYGDAGMDGYVAKPIDVVSLMDAIANAAAAARQDRGEEGRRTA